MLCLVLNDRQKVAFRIPAFITENVDEAVLLSNFQTVTVQSSLHRHRLATATITFKLMSANLLGIGVVVVGGQTTEPCAFMHMFVSYDRAYSNAGIGFGLVVCCLSNRLRQRNPDNNYYYQH